MRTDKNASEFETFSAAMDTILKADPKAVKAAMEADKRDRADARRAKKSGIAKQPKTTRKGKRKVS